MAVTYMAMQFGVAAEFGIAAAAGECFGGQAICFFLCYTSSFGLLLLFS